MGTNTQYQHKSVADDDVVYPNGMSTLLDSAANTFLANVKPVFDNSPRNLRKKSSDWMVLDICLFGNFTWIAEIFVKILQIFETFLSICNILVAK